MTQCVDGTGVGHDCGSNPRPSNTYALNGPHLCAVHAVDRYMCVCSTVYMCVSCEESLWVYSATWHEARRFPLGFCACGCRGREVCVCGRRSFSPSTAVVCLVFVAGGNGRIGLMWCVFGFVVVLVFALFHVCCSIVYVVVVGERCVSHRTACPGRWLVDDRFENRARTGEC